MAKSKSDTIQQRLKKARKSANLTQSEAAEKFGLKNASQISKLENGKQEITIGIIYCACIHYKVSVYWLMYGKEPMFADDRENK